MYAVYRLRELGFSVQGFELGEGFGGTWYWNRYPGARCDVESLRYQFTFDPELVRGWEWSERYAQQPEIERYIGYVAERFDLYKHFRFATQVTDLTFDTRGQRWLVETARGDGVTARFVLAATGCLSARHVPDFPGLHEFAGATYHTGAWPRDGVDLTGKRVGVIGTGSSGVQAIPRLAETASRLYVFQRTAQYSVPAGQTAIDSERQHQHKANIVEWRSEALRSFAGSPGWQPQPRSALEDDDEEFRRNYDERWGVGGALDFLELYNDVMSNERANARVADYLRSKIRAIVTDPSTATLLCPTIPIGVKRFLVDTNYFETYNRSNVTLVDVGKRPIERLTAHGLITDGKEYELDVIVFATGYDAMTGPLLRIAVQGRNGLTLHDAWKDGPRTLLGLQVAGFPNLFIVSGPLSPSVLSTMTLGIEQQVDWIADCLVYMRAHHLDDIEATGEAQDSWVDETQELVRGSMRVKFDSWYVGANIPGKPRVFMIYTGGFGRYKARCDQAAGNGYEGFTLRSSDGTGDTG